MLVRLWVAEIVDSERAHIHREDRAHAHEIDVEGKRDGGITDTEHEVIELVAGRGRVYRERWVALEAVWEERTEWEGGSRRGDIILGC